MEGIVTGKLKLKKDVKKKKKKSSKKHSIVKATNEEVPETKPELTKAQQKHLKRKQEREMEHIKKIASKSYREQVDEYNQYLSNLTEHHDIPRISAAGNG